MLHEICGCQIRATNVIKRSAETLCTNFNFITIQPRAASRMSQADQAVSIQNFNYH